MRRPSAFAGFRVAAAAVAFGGGAAQAAVDPGDVGVGPVEAVDGQPLISVPVNNRYRLAVRTATGDRLLPVGSRGMPFDVDVGPGVDGAPVAVYSRCKREPGLSPGNFGVPAYRTGQGCRLYRYDFSTQRERRQRVRTYWAGHLNSYDGFFEVVEEEASEWWVLERRGRREPRKRWLSNLLSYTPNP